MHLWCISPQDASLCCPVTLVLFVDPVHPGDGFACTPNWHSNPRRAARARPRRWPLTPCGPRDGTDERTAADELGASGTFDDFEFEGDQEVVLADLYQFNLACTIYSALLENVTSEQASRMTAMDSATNNAVEAGNKLTVLYNRLRQAKITTELTEIVAGAESV